jgi:hypothetical protein
VLALRHLYSTWGSSGHIQRAASEDLRRPQAASFPRMSEKPPSIGTRPGALACSAISHNYSAIAVDAVSAEKRKNCGG